MSFFSPSGRAERKETARGAVLAKEPACSAGRKAIEGVYSQVKILVRNFMIVNNIIYNRLQLLTRKIVIFIEKYLHDYKNSHIFVVKD
jgi:hypothetical protein